MKAVNAFAVLFAILFLQAARAPAQIRTTVIRVIDGDTVIIKGNIRVRYIGIDAPEMGDGRGPEPFAREATALNQRLVEGRMITLTFDQEGWDQYGRLLAYVWVGPTLVNAELIGAGLAQARVWPPNRRYASLLERREQEARRARRGLWKLKRSYSLSSGFSFFRTWASITVEGTTTTFSFGGLPSR